MMLVGPWCSEDRAVERAKEERRWCKDIAMILGCGSHHETPSTSFDLALIAFFLEYSRYVYLLATNGGFSNTRRYDYARPIALLSATGYVPPFPSPPNEP